MSFSPAGVKGICGQWEHVAVLQGTSTNGWVGLSSRVWLSHLVAFNGPICFHFPQQTPKGDGYVCVSTASLPR